MLLTATVQKKRQQINRNKNKYIIATTKKKVQHHFIQYLEDGICRKLFALSSSAN